MSAGVEIGVVLPAKLPGVSSETVLEWAKLADEGPFSSVAMPDRLSYPNWDPLLTLAAAAATTSRVRLLTAALLGPLRPAAWLAKQVGTLDVLSGGRLVLGVAVGARPLDYQLGGVRWDSRGKLLDEELELLSRLAAAPDPDQDLGPASRADLPVLIGGASPPALRRLLRYGAGYISGGIRPEIVRHELAACRAAWDEAGRKGRMRAVACTWFASDERWDEAHAGMQAYYAKGGPPPGVCDELHRGADGVRRAIERYADLGVDEIVFATFTPWKEELEWLAGVISGGL